MGSNLGRKIKKAFACALAGAMTATVVGIGPFNTIGRVEAAEGDVEINEDNFPDEQLRAAVKKKDNGDNILTKDEIAKIKIIGDSPSFTLNDTTGIQHLTAIKGLYFKCGDKLKNIDLSYNVALEEVSISDGGELTSINLSKCSKLKSLRLFDNGLKELDVSNNKELSELSVVRNPLESLDLSNNKDLTYLNVSCDSLTDFDVSKNTNLDKLSVSSDGLKTIDVSKNTKLTSLDVSQCRYLTSIDISTLVNLIELEMRETALSKIDLSKNVNLEYLSVTETDIRELDISNNPMLIKIYKEGEYGKEGTWEYYDYDDGKDSVTGLIRCDIGTKFITEAKEEKKEEEKKEEKKEEDKKEDSNKKYSNEWVDGKWYNKDGTQTYKGTMQWKSNATGWWIEDSTGWYPANDWQKIDGIWYFFKPDGYMAANEYYNGYWFNKDGSWDSQYFLAWKSNSIGWWVEDISGWWPSNSWLKIDGYWYYFDASGYMVTNRYVDGWWIGADGVCY